MVCLVNITMGFSSLDYLREARTSTQTSNTKDPALREPPICWKGQNLRHSQSRKKGQDRTLDASAKEMRGNLIVKGAEVLFWELSEREEEGIYMPVSGSPLASNPSLLLAVAEPQSLRGDEQTGEAAFRQSLCGEGSIKQQQTLFGHLFPSLHVCGL